MDNLTHTAVGLFLSRAGMNRWTPGATAILLLAANAPDIDIVTLAGGSLSYLHYHRHLTHSLIAAPVMALLSVAVVRVLGRQPVRWAGAMAAAVLGVLSHLALDWTNVYGIRLLLPFSSAWQRLDLTSVVDLWIWSIFLLGVAGPFVARLVSSEITSGGGKPRSYGRGGAIFALVFLLLYESGRSVLHTRAAAMLEARMYEGAAPVRVAAMPDGGNPLRWRGLVETEGFYAVEDINVAGEADPARADIYRKPDTDAAMQAAERTPAFQQFLRWSQFPLWRVLPLDSPENGREVVAIDLRFGTPSAPSFYSRAVVDGSGRVVEAAFHWGPARVR
jgi:inner membrane protein